MDLYCLICRPDWIKTSKFRNVKKISKIIRKNSKIPIGVGFGIRTKSDVSKVIKIADATIVGSGIVDIVGKNSKNHNLTKKVGFLFKKFKKRIKQINMNWLTRIKTFGDKIKRNFRKISYTRTN